MTGFDVRASGPGGLARRVAKEVPMWRDIIVQLRIELQWPSRAVLANARQSDFIERFG